MKIVINCWVLRNKQLDGIGYFTVNTISRIIKNHPETRFVLLCDKKFKENYFDFENAEIVRFFPPYRHPLLYVFYLEVFLPIYLKKLKPDVFVSAEGFLSLMSSCKQLPLIYDLNFEHFPENLAFKNRIYFRFFFRRFAKKAKRIATISDYSKNDICNLYKIDASLVDNVSCGINSNFSKLESSAIQSYRNKVSRGEPYFFFIGSMHPRKNVHRLIKAFNEFKKNTGSGFHLVIGGAMRWSKSEIMDEYEKSPWKNDISFVGRLSDEELRLALGSAYALSFVPVFEGFGLPIVEAFQAGVPVLASNVTSLPEVAGDAAVYADPFDVASIAEAMEKMYRNENDFCKTLIEKGDLRKKIFTWDRSSELLWESILKSAD